MFHIYFSPAPIGSKKQYPNFFYRYVYINSRTLGELKSKILAFVEKEQTRCYSFGIFTLFTPVISIENRDAFFSSEQLIPLSSSKYNRLSSHYQSLYKTYLNFNFLFFFFN